MEAAPGDQKSLLRLLTCGSVDDGKSTLIGRLLHDCQGIMTDTMAAITRDSRKHGTVGEEVDLALLLDGLEAEREQGITIDVAYRFFHSGRRAFIVADTPGHEQYTRNMVTGASNCELAIILVDARKGLLPQTFRHSVICSLLGIRHVVLAVNKMDLVGFDQAVFDRVRNEYAGFAGRLGFEQVVPIPLCARLGDNVVRCSPAMAWHGGPTLLEHLERVTIDVAQATAPFRFPVQWVNRPNLDFRGLSGTVAGGAIAVGDPVRVVGGRMESRIASVHGPSGPQHAALAGEAVTLVLEDQLDVARGEMLAPPHQLPNWADQFSADLVWMDETALFPGRKYLMRIGHRWINATITKLAHRLEVATSAQLPARRLDANEIGYCQISTTEPVAFDPYSENRLTGSFILVDGYSNRTLAAGMIRFGLRRADNIRQEALLVGKDARGALLGQKPMMLWFTGLSGSGKSTVAKLVEQRLHEAGLLTYMLDGDNLRFGLNRDLGFTQQDRVENIRRIAEVGRLFVDAGVIVLCAAISPYRAEREAARQLIAPGEFVEIFMDTPIEECERRDAKGLYAKARAGTLPNFTGIGSPYEAPQSPDIHLQGTCSSQAEALAAQVLAEVWRRQG